MILSNGYLLRFSPLIPLQRQRSWGALKNIDINGKRIIHSFITDNPTDNCVLEYILAFSPDNFRLLVKQTFMEELVFKSRWWIGSLHSPSTFQLTASCVYLRWRWQPWWLGKYLLLQHMHFKNLISENIEESSPWKSQAHIIHSMNHAYLCHHN